MIPGHEFVGRVVELDDEVSDMMVSVVGDCVVSGYDVAGNADRKRGQYHM